MRLTAKHMLASHSGTAPVTVFAEADATGLVDARRRLVSATGAPRTSYSHLLVKILAEALVRHPRLNAAFGDDGLKIFDEINIGVAMAMPDGNLIVPVIHCADRLGLSEIVARMDDLRSRGRAGKFTTGDVRGGTFTLSNAGMVDGVRWTTPLLNLPQCAILATGAVAERAVVRDGEIVARWILDLSVTFDHRAINGLAVAEFTRTLAGLIAEPALLVGLPAAAG
jgi:pyruvate/2-oxoglutarate dehydrogenase complex dihydrolipoamide acyltransferase (E2) component